MVTALVGHPAAQLMQQLRATPSGVLRVLPPSINKQGNAATFGVIPTTRPAAIATADLVGQLRASIIPPAIHGSGLTAYVGGVTAANVDLALLYKHDSIVNGAHKFGDVGGTPGGNSSLLGSTTPPKTGTYDEWGLYTQIRW